MFDDIIKDKANEHEAPVPPETWDNIAKKKKKKRFAFWWWGSAMLLLMLGAAAYLFLNNTKSKPVASSGKSPGENIATDKTALSQSNTDEPVTYNSNTGTDYTSTQNNSAGDNKKNSTSNSTGVSASTSVIKTQQGNGAEINAQKGFPGKLPAYKHSLKKIIKSHTRVQSSAPAPEETALNETTASVVPGSNISANKNDNKNNVLPADIKVSEATEPVTTNKRTTGKEEKKTEPANENKKENKSQSASNNKKHWYIDAGITPLVALQQYDAPVSYIRTRFLNNNLTEYNAQLVKTSIDPSVAFSLMIRRSFTDKWQAGIGLQYLLLKENISIEGKEKTTAYSVVQRLVNGSNGPQLVDDTVATVTEGTRTVTAVNSYHLYSIPVYLYYNIVHRNRWNLSVTGGACITISGSYQNEINRGATALLLPVTGNNNGSSIGYALFAGFRIGKTVGRRAELFAMPAISLAVSDHTFKNSMVNNSLKQASVGFGVSYRIK